MIINFQAELAIMRKNFAENRPKSISLHRPWWMIFDEELSKLYKEKNTLLQQGEIYYAHLVQANVKLFQKMPPFDYPAQILYSIAPNAEEDPILFEKPIEFLYSYKSGEKAPPKEWKAIIENIQDEQDRSLLAFDCPTEAGLLAVRMQTIMVFRKHLPTRILQGRIFPILACPASLDSALILPCRYWSENFKNYWLSE